MTILGIDTSGKTASCAVMTGQRLLAEKTVYTKLTHSQIILPMAEELLADCGLELSEIDAVVCAKGPGSYTGLRIGIAAVKGLCMGSPSLKCAGVSTLEALAWSSASFTGRIVPVMYARPDVVYCGVYESDGVSLRCTAEDAVRDEAGFFGALDVSAPLLLTGDRCAEIKEKYFAGERNVMLAPVADRLQKASALCQAYLARPELAVPAEALEASYLQPTKAEKLKK